MHSITATKIIDDLNPYMLEASLRHLLDLVRKHQPTNTWRGADVYELGTDAIGYIVLIDNSQVVYFVRYRRVPHNGVHFGRQILLWSDKGSVASVGFARHIFFNVLLPKFGALLADQEQTEAGARFWRNNLEFAFDHGLYVYCLDRRSTPNALIPIPSFDAIRGDLAAKMWGTSEGHKRTCAVISRQPFSIRNT